MKSDEQPIQTSMADAISLSILDESHIHEILMSKNAMNTKKSKDVRVAIKQF
jgi:hypothetical protein